MAIPTALPFDVGYVDQGTYTGLLGTIYAYDDKFYRVVRSTGTIAAGSGGTFVATALSSGAPTWNVAINGTAKNPNVVGVIPAVHPKTGSSINTAAFAAGDVFLIQVAGPGSVQVASSNVINTAANNGALMADSNGLAALIASSLEGGAPVFYAGYATNTTAATSGTLRTVMLEGLL